MEKEFTLGQMADVMKDNIRTTRNMVKGSTLGQMARSTTAAGKMESKMEKEHFTISLTLKLALGRMVNVLETGERSKSKRRQNGHESSKPTQKKQQKISLFNF